MPRTAAVLRSTDNDDRARTGFGAYGSLISTVYRILRSGADAQTAESSNGVPPDSCESWTDGQGAGAARDSSVRLRSPSSTRRVIALPYPRRSVTTWIRRSVLEAMWHRRRGFSPVAKRLLRVLLSAAFGAAARSGRHTSGSRVSARSALAVVNSRRASRQTHPSAHRPCCLRSRLPGAQNAGSDGNPPSRSCASMRSQAAAEMEPSSVTYASARIQQASPNGLIRRFGEQSAAPLNSMSTAEANSSTAAVGYASDNQR